MRTEIFANGCEEIAPIEASLCEIEKLHNNIMVVVVGALPLPEIIHRRKITTTPRPLEAMSVELVDELINAIPVCGVDIEALV